MPDNAIVIAVDGGGSKTDGVAVDLDGTIIARVRKPGSSPQLIDLAPAVNVIDAVITQLSEEAGDRPLIQTNIYLSGLDHPVELDRFSEAIATKSWATGVTGNSAVIDNDMFALLRSGTSERDAVAVVCGTGINCLGVRRDGQHARFPALGMISGDWGGGWFLGEQALWHAARAVDGRGEPTMLATMIPDHLGLPDIASVIDAFHFDRLDRDRLAQMAPLVFTASDAGDEVAGRIVDRQAEEVVEFAFAAIRRLDLAETPLPVVLGGGVLAADHERLLRGIRGRLAKLAPKATTTLVRSRPILGAALFALEQVGASSSALEKARAALEYRE